MRVLLDTSFILTCARQKIDFASYLNKLIDEKIDFLVPEGVIFELERISERKGEKLEDRNAAKLSLLLVKDYDQVPLGTKIVDFGIVRYFEQANTNDFVLASVDKALMDKVKSRKITLKGKKELQIK